jgi:hypothetical protein
MTVCVHVTKVFSFVFFPHSFFPPPPPFFFRFVSFPFVYIPSTLFCFVFYFLCVYFHNLISAKGETVTVRPKSSLEVRVHADSNISSLRSYTHTFISNRVSIFLYHVKSIGAHFAISVPIVDKKSHLYF